MEPFFITVIGPGERTSQKTNGKCLIEVKYYIYKHWYSTLNVTYSSGTHTLIAHIVTASTHTGNVASPSNKK